LGFAIKISYMHPTPEDACPITYNIHI
jgi:hypothetical protein